MIFTMSLIKSIYIGSIKFARNVKYVSRRNYSHVMVQKEENSSIAVVCLNRPPVNSLNLEFLNEFTAKITELEADDCKGFILTSAIPNVFSAGLDIRELHAPDKNRFSVFWKAVQDMWIKLYSTRMFSIAAVTGNAPGAGCILALCCDYRIMLNSTYSIGVGGTRLGMISPWWFEEVFARTVGHRETELALTLAKSYTPQEALNIGLVDELAPTADMVLSNAQKELQKYIRIPELARQVTKKQLRMAVVEKLLATRDIDVENYITFINQAETQLAIGKYLEKLTKKKQSS